MLGQIVEASFDKPEYEQEARTFCKRILAAIKAYQIYAMEIGDVIEALTTVNPLAVLDILVEEAAEDEEFGRALFEDLRSNRPCPLDSIAPDVWLGWAAARPETRFVYLAQVMRFSQGKDDEASSKGWSAASEQIINVAPDPAKVLNIFMDRFEPRGGWVGSLADIMASRTPMIEVLAGHRRPEVAAWANENIGKFNDRMRVSASGRLPRTVPDMKRLSSHVPHRRRNPIATTASDSDGDEGARTVSGAEGAAAVLAAVIAIRSLARRIT